MVILTAAKSSREKISLRGICTDLQLVHKIQVILTAGDALTKEFARTRLKKQIAKLTKRLNYRFYEKLY